MVMKMAGSGMNVGWHPQHQLSKKVQRMAKKGEWGKESASTSNYERSKAAEMWLEMAAQTASDSDEGAWQGGWKMVRVTP
jgi:DNA-binding transcriptional regulator PaaX